MNNNANEKRPIALAHDYEMVRAKSPGHMIEMKQEIKNLEKVIREIRAALARGGEALSVEQELELEKALEAAIQLRDNYQSSGCRRGIAVNCDHAE